VRSETTSRAPIAESAVAPDGPEKATPAEVEVKKAVKVKAPMKVYKK